ncbi:MAG UNVERIFIED_CONTAM: OprO/OprP family phosphate-selective porin [Planctomycetaceae bacterium]|jgi:hypothetical protein
MILRLLLILVLTRSSLSASRTFADEPVLTTAAPPPADRFEATLLELEQRLQLLEEENQQLRKQFDASLEAKNEIQLPAIDELRRSRISRTLRVTYRTFAQEAADAAKTGEPEKPAAPKEKKWFEKYTVRGYVQLRANDVLDRDGPANPQAVGDSSIGDRQSFLLRRVRMIIQGDVSEHVSLYFQPDFAAAVPGSPDSNQFAQIRDVYADVHLDDKKELRFRVGQSKIPYGWENLQSSSNRLPLDRNDALNSACRNERDLGIFFYWTPVEAAGVFQVYQRQRDSRAPATTECLVWVCITGREDHFANRMTTSTQLPA